MAGGLDVWLAQQTPKQIGAIQWVAILCVYILIRAPFEYRKHLARRAAIDSVERIMSLPVVAAELKLSIAQFGIDVDGRTDEVRQFKNGLLIVGDTKTRTNWTLLDDDVYELSLYRYLLKNKQKGSKVSDHGYIRFVNPDTGRECFQEVALLGDAWAAGLIKRYAEVAQGQRPVQKMADVNRCGKCEFVSACYNVKDDDDDGDVEPLLCDDGFSDSAPGWSVGRLGI